MKKILLLIIFALTVVACSGNQKTIKLEDINLDKIEEKIENKEKFAVIVSSKKCSHCNAFKEMLSKYESNNTIFVFEVTTASKEDIQKLTTKFPSITGTPTTLFFENGEAKDIEVGFTKDTITEKLNNFYK